MTSNLLTSARDLLLELLFPLKCVACEKVPMPKASRIRDGRAIGKTNRIKNKLICTDCLKELRPSLAFFCPLCEAKTADGKLCFSCDELLKSTGNNFALDRLLHSFSYKDPKIQKIVKAYKYHFIKDLELPLSRLVISYLDKIKISSELNDSIILPIPLHQRKFNQRGYNQSELLADRISMYLGVQSIKNVLIKTRSTKDQAKLKEMERLGNLKNAFVCQKPELVSGKKILLIDDVYTTGATMTECARLLKQAGAKEITGLVIARG